MSREGSHRAPDILSQQCVVTILLFIFLFALFVCFNTARRIRKQFSHAEVSMKDYQYKIATGARECKEHPAELKNINCNEMAQSRSGGEEAAD